MVERKDTFRRMAEPHPAPLPQPKRMGRPRLSSPERRRRILASKAKWRDANREYYRAQINQLSSRPEYKARRRELRARARAVRAREEHAPEEALGRDVDPEYTLWDMVP